MNQNDGATASVKFHDDSVVVNQDGITMSPVKHQFDCYNELKLIILKRTKILAMQWKNSLKN